jgi:bacillithiol system protein YtxJ
MNLLYWLHGVLFGPGNRVLEDFGVKELRSIEEIEGVFSESAERPVFIFKHSTACPISAAAHRRVSQYLETRESGGAPFYLVKVIESRPVSNLIAEELGVKHQSPQLILVRAGKAVWNVSHAAISAEAILRVLENG